MAPLALVEVGTSGLLRTDCLDAFARAWLHPTARLGAAPVDGGIVEFQLDDSGVRLGSLAPLPVFRDAEFYPLDGQSRLFVRGDGQDLAFDVTFRDGRVEVAPSALAPRFFLGMTAVDGERIDALNAGADHTFVVTSVDADGGVTSTSFATELAVSDGYKLAPHLGRPALFFIGDGGAQPVLRGRYLR